MNVVSTHRLSLSLACPLSSIYIYIWIENSGPKSEASFVLNGNRAGPLSKISTDPRSWVTGLGISHINAKARAGSPKQAECYANILL